MSQTQNEDSRDLARFGYRQELDRSLGGFSSFAAGFSYISIMTGVFQMFHLGYAAGGPAFFWTWPMVLAGQFTVALCFAELSARVPLSGGIYQWSKLTGSPALGWLTGWVYLACQVISLAAVALALQATLPQIDPRFQLIGDISNPSDHPANAVVLGCLLIGLTTAINAVGVRLMARVNNVGVCAELIGVVLLIVLLAMRARRGPGVVFTTYDAVSSSVVSGGGIGAFLAAAVMPAYVMYGFDTAGTLAEETDSPRRRAPLAILRALMAAGLAGGALIIAGLMAAEDPADPELGKITGGLPAIVKQALGPQLGTVFLIEVVFAVSVCALAVHAGTVRLFFAMARDNNLPFARQLSRVQPETRTPLLPALLTGGLAATILVLNVNLPRMIETLCSIAIIWANLAYLMVTFPLLLRRLAGWPASRSPVGDDGGVEGAGLFTTGRFGLALNLAAVAWGIVLVANMSWPRAEIYGMDPWGRYAAVLATIGLLAPALAYYVLVQRRRTGILDEHSANPAEGDDGSATAGLAGPRGWLTRLAQGD